MALIGYCLIPAETSSRGDTLALSVVRGKVVTKFPRRELIRRFLYRTEQFSIWQTSAPTNSLPTWFRNDCDGEIMRIVTRWGK